MEISVRDIHNDMMKLYDNGGLTSVVDSVTYKVLINDKTIKIVYTTTGLENDHQITSNLRI